MSQLLFDISRLFFMVLSLPLHKPSAGNMAAVVYAVLEEKIGDLLAQADGVTVALTTRAGSKRRADIYHAVYLVMCAILPENAGGMHAASIIKIHADLYIDFYGGGGSHKNHL